MHWRLEHLINDMRTIALLICTSLLLLAADVADMSGTWVVNTQRSKWGKRPAPKNVDLVIEHRDPSFHYKGTIHDSQDMAPTQFEFTGSIDGKEYSVKEGSVERKIKFTRKGPRAVETVSYLQNGV
ncbi:MAG: hypothetical protein WKF37_08400, partial [Bryobacteraceae bacterium]